MNNLDCIKIIEMARAQVEWDYPMDYAAAFDKAIEALKQEPILGKIRAEIKQLKPYDFSWDERTPEKMLNKVLEIIDKYKAESEEQA